MSETSTSKPEFKARVLGWAEKLGASVTSISVRPMATKWASYSTTGRLTFDCSLLELGEELQDYVIAHELLHSHAPNHGKLWKSLMRAHLGEHEQLELELRRVARLVLQEAGQRLRVQHPDAPRLRGRLLDEPAREHHHRADLELSAGALRQQVSS
jgi:hypothetical protein